MSVGEGLISDAPPMTLGEWILALPEEDRKRLSAIVVYTPFARHFLQRAWEAGAEQARWAQKKSAISERIAGYPRWEEIAHRAQANVPISTRRKVPGGVVHEMADLGVDFLCGSRAPEPFDWTGDPVTCKRCERSLRLKQAKVDREELESLSDG